MIIKILLDENNYVCSYATIGNMKNAITAELSDELFDNFENFFKSYYYEDGALFFDEQRNKSNEEGNVKAKLRLKRENECFPIINRGKLWYDLLTEEQIIELNNWYAAWLDVTDTLSVPVKPEWLLKI